ncbi:MAG: hypothetical protein M3Y75_10750 [Actinomycetota bacterium]|nr:hypothetical protein [Actinomycetota bacterium]
MLAPLLALAAFCAVSGPASAAVVSGSNLAAAPNNTTCLSPVMSLKENCTMAIAALPAANQAPGGPTAAISGVIVEWKVRSGPSVIPHTVRLRVIRGNTGVGAGPLQTLPADAGIHAFPARLPVQAGDRIGFDLLENPWLEGVQFIRSGVPGAGFEIWVSKPLADGESRAPAATSNEIELLMNATIEPDGDGDGYGDETQDGCPGVAAAIVPPCSQPTQPTQPAQTPNTTIAKGPKGKIATRRATFRFTATVAGSTFQCKLGKEPFKACKTPKTYKGLADGQHTFKVRAIGPTGLVDPTPAKRTFRVEA